MAQRGTTVATATPIAALTGCGADLMAPEGPASNNDHAIDGVIAQLS